MQCSKERLILISYFSCTTFMCAPAYLAFEGFLNHFTLSWFHYTPFCWETGSDSTRSAPSISIWLSRSLHASPRPIESAAGASESHASWASTAAGRPLWGGRSKCSTSFLWIMFYLHSSGALDPIKSNPYFFAFFLRLSSWLSLHLFRIVVASYQDRCWTSSYTLPATTCCIFNMQYPDRCCIVSR